MLGTDANKQRTIETEVVVIGGGIAGLTAASELAAAGTDVAVLEARDRVGGRTWNTEIGGEANELGGQWVAPYQSAMHELLADLEIELFPSFRTGEHVYVDPKGTSHRYDGHDAPMGQVSEKAFEVADAKLDSLAKELDPEAPWEHPDAERLDGITLESWLRDEVSDEMARDLLRSWLAGGFLAKPAHTFSLLQALWMIAGAGGTYELFEPDQCLAYRVVGGSQLISIRLAERLGERVALNAAVREIRWGEDSVEVEADRVVAKGRRAIVAVPPNLTNSIRFRPALPAWRMRMAQAMSQGSINKVLAVYETPFWREDGLSGQGFAPYELVRELYDNSPPSASAGVLCTFLAGENAERAGRLGTEERRREVLQGMAKYVGARALEPVDYIETDWSAQEWTRGAYGTSFGPGGLTRFRDDIRRPVGSIQWACTDIAGVGHIHMEGAIRSGRRAAESCLEGVAA
jgi:putrescine oxidase